MKSPVPYSELKTETKLRRRTHHQRNPKQTNARIDSIVMNATFDNPVSVLDLGKCTDFARHCLMLGASDDDAIRAVTTYIKQLNGNPVG